MYPWLLVIQVKRCWDGIRTWLSDYFPEALPTLQKGASEDEINELETILEVNLPLPMRVIYRFFNGQDAMSDIYPDMDGSPLGIIGGYTYYSNSVNVFLFPIKQIIKESGFNRPLLGPNYIAIASSSTSCPKQFFLNCETGQLYVATRNFLYNSEIMSCVRSNSINSKDGMLLWLEEHVNRLRNGIIKTRDEGNCRSICLFPEEEPLCSTAITWGIKVRASAVLVPEFSDPPNEFEKYLFVYSIRMSLLPNTCSLRSFETCQLSRRNLIHYVNDIVSQEFEGDGVLGLNPILSPIENEFIYQSRASLPTSPASMDGSYTFVPGRISDPEGSPFEVEVARFPLELPDYIF